MKKILSSKLIFIITLSLQVVIFAFLLSKNIMLKNNAVKNNRIYAFSCTLYDPYNVLKGRYVRLENAQETVNLKDLDFESINKENAKNLIKNESVFLLIKPDSNGIWNVYGIRKHKPKSGDFIKAKFNYSTEKSCYFDFSINEYYMQENFAEYVDKTGFKEISSMKIEVYCDKNGNLLQKQLYVQNGSTYIPIENYIKDKLAE